MIAVTTPVGTNVATALASNLDRDPSTCAHSSRGFTELDARLCWPSAVKLDSPKFDSPGKFIVPVAGSYELLSVKQTLTDEKGQARTVTARDGQAWYRGQLFWQQVEVQTWWAGMHYGVTVGSHGYWGVWDQTDWVSPFCNGFGSCDLWWYGVAYNGATSSAGANFRIGVWFGAAVFYCRTYTNWWQQFSGWCG